MLDQAHVRNIIETIRSTAAPDEISIFGSYGAGSASDSSDFDVLVVDNSGRDKNDLALAISKALFPRDYALDLVIVSSQEMEQRASYSFWRSILDSRKVVYVARRD